MKFCEVVFQSCFSVVFVLVFHHGLKCSLAEATQVAVVSDGLFRNMSGLCMMLQVGFILGLFSTLVAGPDLSFVRVHDGHHQVISERVKNVWTNCKPI